VGASAAVCLTAASPPALAHGSNGKPLTKARFLHAVPMAAPAVLIVHGHPPRLLSSYGKPSAYHACHPGPARLELKVKGQAKPAATANIDIGRGRYTVIAVPDGDGVGLRVYKDGTAVPGKARVRTINAAAELGQAAMNVDGQAVARIAPDKATRYASVPPGRHDLSITRPSGAGGTLASARGVPLVAGSASTAIVVGSGGEPARVLVVSDQTAGPSVAPATGLLGDAGDGGPWLLVALAASVAGSLGGTMYLRAARRRPAAPLLAAGLPRALDVPSAPAHPRPPTAPAQWEVLITPPVRNGSWMLTAAAALTAGSLARRLYRAGRRRRGS
jgi:hypothetical protein